MSSFKPLDSSSKAHSTLTVGSVAEAVSAQKGDTVADEATLVGGYQYWLVSHPGVTGAAAWGQYTQDVRTAIQHDPKITNQADALKEFDALTSAFKGKDGSDVIQAATSEALQGLTSSDPQVVQQAKLDLNTLYGVWMISAGTPNDFNTFVASVEKNPATTAAEKTALENFAKERNDYTQPAALNSMSSAR